VPRSLNGDIRPARDRPPIAEAQEHLFLVVPERLLPLAPDLLLGGQRPRREHRRCGLVPRQRQVELEEIVDHRLLGTADFAAHGKPDLDAARHLLVAVCLLLPEAEPEPGVDELRLRRQERVVALVALLDPAGGGMSVEIARVLRVLDGVPGQLDPDVRAPDLRRLRSSDHVADKTALAKRSRAAHALVAAEMLERRKRLAGVLEARIEQRFDDPVAGMAGREQPGRVLQVLVGKGHELKPAHGT